MKNCEFLGVYIEDENAIEYRIGYRLSDGDYKPIIEEKLDDDLLVMQRYCVLNLGKYCLSVFNFPMTNIHKIKEVN